MGAWDGTTERRNKHHQCSKFVCGLSDDALEEFMDVIAERGAKKALASIGLADEKAGSDVKELRDLLTGWRAAKSSAVREFGKMAAFVVLILILLGVVAAFKAPDKILVPLLHGG